MPRKPNKPCAFPMCPNLVAPDKRFCPAHATAANREYNRFKRDPETNSRYGRSWRAIRNVYISHHPMCERCLEHGFYRPAEEVHHVVPLDEGGSNEDENLMSLCKSCHSRITITATNSD